MSTPLLMIPGPIEVSPSVVAAYSVNPPSHVAPNIIEDFSEALKAMRGVWCASEESHPFVIAGSGTIAMDMAVSNLIDPGDAVLLVDTGYFSVRMGEMLARRGAVITRLSAPPGHVPTGEDVVKALSEKKYVALFATHVDTSTGARVPAEEYAKAARHLDVLSVFDGVCATAGEAFEMDAWGADLYLTASQKAVGLPAGLSLMVASVRAMEKRHKLVQMPPMSLDWLEWAPIMKAYEEGRASYFSTPATNMIAALKVGLGEILSDEFKGFSGIQARVKRHMDVAAGMRAAWNVFGLQMLPTSGVEANTLSAICYPAGVDASLVGAIKKRGVVVAGGLHPDLKKTYFRVGHMGHILTEPQALVRTVESIGYALGDMGYSVDVEGAVHVAQQQWDE